MTLQDGQALLARITYKPGHTFTLTHNELGVHMSPVDAIDKQDTVTIGFRHRCTITEMDHTSFVLAVWRLVLAWETHELCEWLQLDNKRIINPHTLAHL